MRVWSLLFLGAVTGCGGSFLDLRRDGGGWGFRKKVTIDETKVSADLTGFPVFLDLADLGPEFFARLESAGGQDGGDIRVSAWDGVTEVPRELVTIDPAAGTGELHFLAPALSASMDTDFYVYYANPDVSEPPPASALGRAGVWTGEHAGVWHLDEDPSAEAPQMTDSAPAAGDGSASGGMTAAARVEGKIGRCLDFDGVDDYISVPHSAELDVSGAAHFTLSAWIRPSVGGVWHGIVGKGGSCGNDCQQYYLSWNSSSELGRHGASQPGRPWGRGIPRRRRQRGAPKRHGAVAPDAVASNLRTEGSSSVG